MVVILVGVLLVTTAAVPLNVTRLLDSNLSKFVPMTVTTVPGGPEGGLKLSKVGETAGPDELEAAQPAKRMEIEKKAAHQRSGDPMKPSS
jgi:hypothetical protein